MYDPKVGRWLSVDPLSFEAGDHNLYRYVKNDPTNGTDPSGLVDNPGYERILDRKDLARKIDHGPAAPMTEDRALCILRQQIRDWELNEGWHMAPHLLKHFIDKKGPNPYIPQEDDVTEVKAQSQSLVKYYLFLKAVNGKLTLRNGETFTFGPDSVRWLPTDAVRAAVIGAGAIWGKRESAIVVNDPMFYAFGGARLSISGTVSNVKRDVSTVTFDVTADVTIHDTYEFSDKGAVGERLWWQAYKAAYYLQTQKGYKGFEDEVKFSQTYKEILLENK
jgi:hypothetical protein